MYTCTNLYNTFDVVCVAICVAVFHLGALHGLVDLFVDLKRQRWMPRFPGQQICTFAIATFSAPWKADRMMVRDHAYFTVR